MERRLPEAPPGRRTPEPDAFAALVKRMLGTVLMSYLVPGERSQGRHNARVAEMADALA